MFVNRKDMMACLDQDRKAMGRKSIYILPFISGDEEVWSFIVLLRRIEYHLSFSGIKKYLFFPILMIEKICYRRKSVKLGFSVPYNIIQPGLAIVHHGSLTISSGAAIGRNCRIHEGVTIGATNGSSKAATIGDNVFIGSGAKIIGEVNIASDVCIAAGAVVVKSIEEAGTTWGGVPARKISNNNSRKNLSKQLEL